MDANVDVSRGPNDGDDSVLDYGVGINGNIDQYFSEGNDKVFYFGGGSYTHQDSAVDDNIGVTVGLGYGRVWNATPLAYALRIQDKLNQYGLLSKEYD